MPDFFTTEMLLFFQNPELFLAKSEGPYFKNDPGDTTTIKVIEIGDKKFVAKRYNIKNFWHGIKKNFCKSGALKSWQNIFYLQRHGIDTLTPIALLEKRTIFWGKTAYLLTEYVENAIRGCDYFAPEKKPLPEWNTIANRIIEIIKKLQKAKIYHHDFQYGNMLITEDKVILLDLDHVKFYRYNNYFFRKAHQKDIKHFLDFVAKNPDAFLLFQRELAKLYS